MSTLNIPTKNRYEKFSILIFFLISAALFYSFFVDKQFCADGIHYFILILKNKTFTNIAPSRILANFIDQWPIVLALKLGITNLSILSWLFALGLYLPYLLTFLICMHILKKENSALILFFFAGILSINFSSDFILAGEHHILIILSWPILFILLSKEKISYLHGTLLIILLILFTDLYESGIIVSLIFMSICVVRFYFFKSIKQRVLISAAILISLIAIIISAYYIINPRDIKNISYFIVGLTAPFKNINFLCSASFIFLYFLSFIFKERLLRLLTLIPLFVYIILICFGITDFPHVSFASRTLTGTFLPILIVFTIFAYVGKITLTKRKLFIYLLFTITVILGNMYSSYKWNEFHNSMINILKKNTGIVRIENTKLIDSKYYWGWNSAELSLVWSKPTVKSILADNPNNGLWKTYNPLKPDFLDIYIHHNISFNAKLNSNTILKNKNEI
jgi:hypothetical protein